LTSITDPVVLATIVQTVVITLTLLIFILSFRSQDKAIREQAYQRVMDDYGDIMRRLSDTPELYKFQIELFNTIGRPLTSGGKELTREDMVARNYVIGMYGFFERLHALYRRKWIDQDTWRQWAAFLNLMARHPLFKDVHESSKEMWDQPFVEYVDGILRHNT
jgi:hypothetical protein